MAVFWMRRCHSSVLRIHADIDRDAVPGPLMWYRDKCLFEDRFLSATRWLFEVEGGRMLQRWIHVSQADSDSVGTSHECQMCITSPVVLIIICALLALPESSQSGGIGSFGSRDSLRKNHPESPSVWQFRSVKSAGLHRVSNCIGKSLI